MCVFTISKSQGRTFNQIVYHYDNHHKQQYVYVAFSRMTSLESVIITNVTKNLTLCHIHVEL